MTLITSTLSEKEVAIIQYLSEGVNQKEIARLLSISKKTLEQDLIKIRYKTGTRNCPHLVSWAHQNKVLGKHSENIR